MTIREEALHSIEGMWCTSCALAVEAQLHRQPRVHSASVNYATATLLVSGEPDAIELASLQPSLRRLGYRLVPLADAADVETRLSTECRRLTLRLLVAAGFGMWTMLASLLIYAGATGDSRLDYVLALVSGAFSLPVVGYAAVPFYRAGWRTLLARRPGMDTLVSLGVWGALMVSAWLLWQGTSEVYFDTAVMLVLLLLAGRLVEIWCRLRGHRALARLHQPPSEVTLLTPGGQQRRPIEEVLPGDCLRVVHGEVLPLDGELVDASALLDLASLSGESHPVRHSRGDALLAGCRNLETTLTLRVTAPHGQGYLDHLYRRTQEWHARKGDLQRLADRFAAWLSPLAIGLALLTLFTLLVWGVPINDAVVRALSVLVVACPCAVGLAIPLVILAATDKALAQGAVFRDLNALESVGQAQSVAFDKTGTLTRGHMSVVALEPGVDIGADHLLRLAVYAEAGSEHPLARAIRRAASERGLLDESAAKQGVPASASEHAGAGRVVNDGQPQPLAIGRPDWLAERGVTLPDLPPSPHIEIGVARGSRWLGRLLVDDTADPQARRHLQGWREKGVALALISGDRPDRVHAMAETLGFAEHECYAGQSPDTKARLVAALPRPSLYIGDGINDVLALATADVGVAPLGAAPQARESAALQLLEPGLAGIERAWQIARQARRIMRQNLALAVLYNLLALGLVAWMAIPPLVAVLAMAASSLSVILNAARLQFGSDHEVLGRGERTTTVAASP